MPARRPGETRRLVFEKRSLAPVLKAAPTQGLVLLVGGPDGERQVVAQRLANERGQKLQRVDLAEVTDKYVGETEKNLRKLFAEARRSDAVLFFDEADALFGKRSDVRDSHDRYANTATGYLLRAARRTASLVIVATDSGPGRYEDVEAAAALLVDFSPKPAKPLPRRDLQELAMRSTAAPLSALHFRVLLNGEDLDACHVSGMTSLSELVPAKRKRRDQEIQMTPGPARLETLIVRRALSGSRLLYDWRQRIAAGKKDRRTLELQQLPVPHGKPVHVWRFVDCWPCRWSGPEFDALTGELAFEEVEICYARFIWL